MSHKARSLILLLVFFAAALPCATAQEENVQKKTRIQDDLDFARELARYRYFGLANDYVTEIKKGHLSDEENATLTLTNAEILKWGAEYSLSRSDRFKYYKEAVDRYKEFIEYNTDHPDYNRARIDLAVLYQSFGQFLAQEMHAAADPAKKKEYKEQAESAFREGTLLFNDTSRDLRKQADAYVSDGEQDLADKAVRKAAEAEYKKGVAYYNWAMLYDKEDFNRGDYLQRTVDTLDDYIWNAPEDDFWTLFAYLYQSKAYAEMGDLDQSLDLAKQIYDPETGISLEDPEKKKLSEDLAKLDPEILKMITGLVESAYYQVAMVQNKQGKHDQAVATVNQLKGLMERCGLKMSQNGDRALLVQAEAYLKLGKGEQAAEVAKDVSDRNPGTEVGKEAKVFLQNLINISSASSSLTAAGPGLSLSPAILFSAAEGSYLEKKYRRAIEGYYKVFGALKTTEQEKKYTAKIWNRIGWCYTQLGRNLEASIAYKTGFESKYARADDSMYEQNGNRWYMAAGKRFKETNNPYDEAIMKGARDTLVNAGVSTDLLYFIAKEKFDKAQLAKGEERSARMKEAIESFMDVKKTSKFYERSLIYLARCYQDLAQYDEAIKRLDEFDKYVRSSPPPATPKQMASRQGTLAEARYYRSEIYLVQEKFKEALDLLDGFEDSFRNQQGFFAAVLYNRILAKIGLKDFSGAEALFKEMKSKQPDSTRIPVASYYIGKAFVTEAESLRGDPDKEPSEEYRKTLKKGADYMYQYCKMTGFDSFANLRNVADWYKELADYETARTVYEKVFKEFGKDPKYKGEIEKNVYRSYGEVLLKLKDFQKAKPIWIHLLNRDIKNVDILRSTARCLGGWLEFDGFNFVEIPGSGDYLPPPGSDAKKIKLDNALGIWMYLLRAFKVNKAYSPEWWEAKLYTIYCFYRAGESDPTSYTTALTLVKNVEMYHPDLGGKKMKRFFKYIEKSAKEKLRKK